jgi:hypothetical protein
MYLDKSVVWPKTRWVSSLVFLSLYIIRVYLLNGFFIVTYALGIYLLNLLIGFLTPAVDPEMSDDGPSLPMNESDEFRPFTRKLPEFQFWYWGTRYIILSIGMTFSSVFDLPVFWPILLMYFIFLFVLTMKQQIMHMIKYRYVPWSSGKRTYESSGKGKI